MSSGGSVFFPGNSSNLNHDWQDGTQAPVRMPEGLTARYRQLDGLLQLAYLPRYDFACWRCERKNLYALGYVVANDMTRGSFVYALTTTMQ